LIGPSFPFWLTSLPRSSPMDPLKDVAAKYQGKERAVV
jgi:hypothetical protein